MNRLRRILGWTALTFSLLFAIWWGVWGGSEAFFEGWYFRSFWQNLGLMVVQYMSPMLITMLLALCAVRWPIAGGALFIAAGVALGFFFHWQVLGLLVAPLVSLGLAWCFGLLERRRLAMRALIVLPLLAFIACAAYPAYRVATRVIDNNYGMRIVEGDGVRLRWAPRGPGWPEKPMTWFEAQRRCDSLSADGQTLASTPQHIWKLPTADEALRSMMLHGVNVGGRYDAAKRKTSWRVRPDKEPPLWDPYSNLIYMWTATEIDPNSAIYVSFNGYAPISPKRLIADHGCRCVSPVK